MNFSCGMGSQAAAGMVVLHQALYPTTIPAAVVDCGGCGFKSRPVKTGSSTDESAATFCKLSGPYPFGAVRPGYQVIGPGPNVDRPHLFENLWDGAGGPVTTNPQDRWIIVRQRADKLGSEFRRRSEVN